MSSPGARLFVLVQRILPKYLLTAVTHRLARIRIVAIKDFLIRQFVNWYKVEVEDVLRPVPEGFATFNEFFVRELADNARPIDQSASSIVSPVDGTVSAAGRIDRDLVFQAKGLAYTLADLLATDIADAERYVDGAFATIYLAPYNYHRVHAPRAGRVIAMRYVPGDLYSVNDATVRHLPGLFTRNERLICHFETDSGPMVLIFVGAMNVGTINTRWTGDIRPRQRGVVESIDIGRERDELLVAKGEPIGWFNMGSTVILLLPPGGCDGFPELDNARTVRMGQAIGQSIHLR